MRTDARQAATRAAMAVLLAATGCAGTQPVPHGWLPKVADVGRDPFGGWVTLQVVTQPVRVSRTDASGEFEAETRDQRNGRLAGELIAVSADSAWVLTASAFVAVARTDVHRAEVVRFDPAGGAVRGCVAAGCLLSLSHGVAFLATFPLWMIIGNAAANAHVKAAVIRYPERNWEDLSVRSRFPAGLPPALDRGALQRRPSTGTGAETSEPHAPE